LIKKDLAKVFNNSAYKLYKFKEDLVEALELSQKAIDLNPTEACFFDTKACILESLGKYREALVFFEKALKYKFDQNEINWSALCHVYTQLGMDDDAKWAERMKPSSSDKKNQYMF